LTDAHASRTTVATSATLESAALGARPQPRAAHSVARAAPRAAPGAQWTQPTQRARRTRWTRGRQLWRRRWGQRCSGASCRRRTGDSLGSPRLTSASRRPCPTSASCAAGRTRWRRSPVRRTLTLTLPSTLTTLTLTPIPTPNPTLTLALALALALAIALTLTLTLSLTPTRRPVPQHDARARPRRLRLHRDHGGRRRGRTSRPRRHWLANPTPTLPQPLP